MTHSSLFSIYSVFPTHLSLAHHKRPCMVFPHKPREWEMGQASSYLDLGLLGMCSDVPLPASQPMPKPPPPLIWNVRTSDGCSRPGPYLTSQLAVDWQTGRQATLCNLYNIDLKDLWESFVRVFWRQTLGRRKNLERAFSQIMRDLFYLQTPEAFTVFNRLAKARSRFLLAIV